MFLPHPLFFSSAADYTLAIMREMFNFSTTIGAYKRYPKDYFSLSSAREFCSSISSQARDMTSSKSICTCIRYFRQLMIKKRLVKFWKKNSLNFFPNAIWVLYLNFKSLLSLSYRIWIRRVQIIMSSLHKLCKKYYVKKYIKYIKNTHIYLYEKHIKNVSKQVKCIREDTFNKY